jgi:hypothetical protein
MGKLLGVVTSFCLLAGFLPAQGVCDCEAVTATVGPAGVVLQPIPWTTGGTVMDVGTVKGQCAKPGCVARSCKHDVQISVWVRYPATAVPVPSLDISLEQNGTPIGTIPVGVTGVTVNPDGTITATFDLGQPTFYTPCLIGPPGGGKVVRRGSVTLTCRNC